LKLASIKPADTRENRLDRLRRDRAGSAPLRTTFPAVQQLRIELQFSGSEPNTPTSQAHVLYPPARAFFDYPCPYTNCDGHFDLTAVVKAVIEGEVGTAKGTIACGGARARDHASKQPCLLQLNYELTACYGDDT
jgi:hypothetical protein